MMKVAVIPAYNESSRVGVAVKDALPHVDAVIVVDDCSVDKTPQEALAAGAHLVRHVINRGQGAALQTGMDYATQKLGADIIVHFDGDGQMKGEEIPQLTEHIENGHAHVVLGSRFLGRKSNMPFSRLLTLKLSLVFTWLVSGVPVTDTHCGFRAYSKEAAEKMRFSLDRMAHASQVYDLLKIGKISYKEHPVTIRYTSDTLAKGMSFKGGFTVLKDFFKHKFFGA